MANTLDMQQIRYLNLFRNVTKISTRFCFQYNEYIIFCVPEKLVSKAIGENGKNAKQLYGMIGKKVKIIPSPEGIENIKKFVEYVVSPNSFKDLEVIDEYVIIHSGGKNKASLIGREKRRFFEMKKIIKNYFNKELKIL